MPWMKQISPMIVAIGKACARRIEIVNALDGMPKTAFVRLGTVKTKKQQENGLRANHFTLSKLLGCSKTLWKNRWKRIQVRTLLQ
jgi:hypothetical protein